jgi:hypothetical protein
LASDLLVDSGLHHPLIKHQPGGRKINHRGVHHSRRQQRSNGTGWTPRLASQTMLGASPMDPEEGGYANSPAIAQVSATGDCRVLHIAKALSITVGGASKVVDKVEAAGSCRRRGNPTDGRSNLIQLTDAGEGCWKQRISRRESPRRRCCRGGAGN